MDAAVALQRKKTIKFLCIVDFSLSKQGVFFVTLRQSNAARIRNLEGNTLRTTVRGKLRIWSETNLIKRTLYGKIETKNKK